MPRRGFEESLVDDGSTWHPPSYPKTGRSRDGNFGRVRLTRAARYSGAAAQVRVIGHGFSGIDMPWISGESLGILGRSQVRTRGFSVAPPCI